MDKPEFMYHASSELDVQEFEPRNDYPRYKGEENLVFATPYKEVAAMFLVPKSIPTIISKYGETYAVFINGSEEDLSLNDKGEQYILYLAKHLKPIPRLAWVILNGLASNPLSLFQKPYTNCLSKHYAKIMFIYFS